MKSKKFILEGLGILFLSLLYLLSSSIAQEVIPDNARRVSEADLKKHGLTQKAIDEAIKKGADWLLKEFVSKQENKEKRFNQPGAEDVSICYDELVLYTLIQAEVKQSDEKFQKILKGVLEMDPKHTYRRSIKAMALRALDPNKYFNEIVECAQFLVDTQCKNGQWSYGYQYNPPKKDDVYTPEKEAPSTPGPKNTKTPQPKKKAKLTKRSDGPEKGDNSNTQYGALGLRACIEAGVEIPAEVLQKAQDWWEADQNEDGGWGYGTGGNVPKRGKGSGTGTDADNKNKNADDAKIAELEKELDKLKDELEKIRKYKNEQKIKELEGKINKLEKEIADLRNKNKPLVGGHNIRQNSYESMTAGGVSSLAIWKFFRGELKKDFDKDSAIADGLKWIKEHFTVEQKTMHEGDGWGNYYYLYSLERAGILANVEKMGDHNWYCEGAKWLLDKQNADGSWPGSKIGKEPKETKGGTCNTCFAILFLKRATEALVPTER